VLTVHLRINDAATGKPTPVRLRLLDGTGQYRPPLGRSAVFPTALGEAVGGQILLGGQAFAYIDGACEAPLTPGPVTVEVSKGPEYSPLRRQATLGPGQLSLRFTVERWADLRADGWLAADTRAHCLSPHAAVLEGAAEGLDIVNVLADDTPDLLAFSGGAAALEEHGCAAVVNTLNSHPVLGTLALLDCHRVVYPLRFGGDLPDDWSLADWCDQCHRKRGLVVWSDLPRLTADLPQAEALASLLLGKVDAFEVGRFDDPEPAVLGDYYRLLDAGCRPALVGGSGKDSNAVALGAVRTYARLEPGQAPDYAAWAAAVRAGRTFATNGPLLTLTADGAGPGAVFDLTPQSRHVAVRVEARATVPFDQVEVLHDGAVIASKPASGARQAAALEAEVNVTRPGWLAARCWSGERLADGQCVYAHTTPVFFRVPQAPTPADPAAVRELTELLRLGLEWVTHQARCDDKHRQRLAGVLQAATDELAMRATGVSDASQKCSVRNASAKRR
jgi:hypothetical protein